MSSRRNPQPNSGNTNRMNEYFVPRDGIDREVITADICRYLGNDALVRPGNYQDESGRPIQGYYITAYRNLTTAMISDLKNDSARWDQERRKHQAGTVRYTESMTYESGTRHSNTGYDTSGGYNNDVKYPGSDAPGYSAANIPGAAAYGQGQAQHWQQGYGYGTQPTQYSQADMRYAQQQQSMAGMGQMPMAPTGYGASQMNQEIYAGGPAGAGAPYRIRGDTHQASSALQYPDTPMTDASMPPQSMGGQQYPSSRPGQAAGYGTYDQSQGSYYTAPSRGAGPYAAQPHDAFIGRKPASAAATAGAAGGGSPMAYEAPETTYDGTTHTPTSRSAAATASAQTQVPTSSSGTTSRNQRERTGERDHDRNDRSERHRDAEDSTGRPRKHNRDRERERDRYR